MKRKTGQPERGPYLTGVHVVEERLTDTGTFPFTLPYLPGLSLDLDRDVTFFVGENGSGKSTLLEAIAELAGFHVAGGGKADVYSSDLASTSLASVLRPRLRHPPRDGFFFRAESFVHFASLLDQRRKDPDFLGDPYERYGGSSLHTKSHGEAFLSVFTHRLGGGLFLFDEPESALSPQRQLALLRLMYDRVQRSGAQFIIATHSPILLTYPGATILDFDSPALAPIKAEETSHHDITRNILLNPERYWRHLTADPEE